MCMSRRPREIAETLQAFVDERHALEAERDLSQSRALHAETRAAEGQLAAMTEERRALEAERDIWRTRALEAERGPPAEAPSTRTPPAPNTWQAGDGHEEIGSTNSRRFHLVGSCGYERRLGREYVVESRMAESLTMPVPA